MIENKKSKYIFLILNIIIAFVIISPLLYALSASFMTEDQLFSYPPHILPPQIQLNNYKAALTMAPIYRFILNSTIIAIVCTVGQLFTGALAGYAFGVLKFKGQKVLFFLMLATMMIPGQAIILANYLTIANMGMIDSYWALILPYLTSAFCVFNMRQAFLQIPVELSESAKIDGCNSFQFFIKIGLPLTKPFLGSLGIYTFLQIWNQYLWPLLVTNTPNMRTVQIGLGMLKNADGNAFGPLMAGSIMILLPSVLVFIIGQKALISGLTAGAVKG